ncbi:phytoene desaturase family protein [Microbacterium sp. F2E]|uniref:phytoene desaturase family protein n=1 Tax=Microbacterium sp. F2E TaxID=2895284 RepID=UPI0035A8658D
MFDAVVVGGGPNGLAAAWTLAAAGLHVAVFERDRVLGGGCRTDEWGSGYRSDWGSAVHPMAAASPFLRKVDIANRLRFLTPEISYAHPLETGVALAWRSLERTASELGIRDGAAWKRLLTPLIVASDEIIKAALSPVPSLAKRPRAGARLAAAGLLTRLGAGLHTSAGRALLGGVVAHSIGRQPQLGTSAAGAVLAMLAHSCGWPIPAGGSQAITDLLHADLVRFGASFHLGHEINAMDQLPAARAYFFDTSARDLVEICGSRVHSRYRRAVDRMVRGNAVSKVDIVVTEPIPWLTRDVSFAGTVHLCGDLQDIRRAEDDVARGRHSERPMIILSQPSLFDPSRAPGGLQMIWAYAHVPAGSNTPQTEAVVRSIERFAPGFRDTVVDTRATTASQIGQRNPTMVGGDFASGALSTRQLLKRPRLSPVPWLAGNGLYLCSTAAAPGPGVHGMGGYGAAQHALTHIFSLPTDPSSSVATF